MKFFLTPLLFLSLIIVVFSVWTIPANAQTFNVNLTIGSRGADVISLQQILVAKGFLQMPSGVPYGYFGPLTRAAVARWQAASGITPPAGFFGPISRAAIVTQIGIHPISSSTSVNSAPATSTPISSGLSTNIETDTSAALGMRAGQVMLFRAFPFEARAGDTIVLDGSGFSRTLNKVYFNGGDPVVATSTDGATLQFSIPNNLAEGEYKLTVSNVWGSSENPSVTALVKVTNNPQPAPTIESASIINDEVTLIGRSFSSSNNLFTTLGDSLSPISSSNGTTLTFHITDLSMYNETRQVTLGRYHEALWIYVQNEHGVNKEPYKLDIII